MGIIFREVNKRGAEGGMFIRKMDERSQDQVPKLATGLDVIKVCNPWRLVF
jgi:hypothetical protein